MGTIARNKGYVFDKEDRTEPRVEHLRVPLLQNVSPEMINAYRRLSRDKLLGIYSQQTHIINIGQCVPGVSCEACPAYRKEEALTGYAGASACSLVRAMLALESNFFRTTIAQEEYICALCGGDIARGRQHVSILQFGLEPIRVCARHLLV